MSDISELGIGGRRATRAIINAYSSGGSSAAGVVSASNTRKVLSGAAVGANVFKTLLSITTAGECPYLAIAAEDTTARTLRVRITIDGVVVFDATSDSITNSGQGIPVVGQVLSSLWSHASLPIVWNASLLVEVASSIAEGSADRHSCIYSAHTS